MHRIATVIAIVLVARLSLPAISSADADINALAPLPPSVSPGVEAIQERDLRSWVTFLSADELEGRQAGERGYDLAALYCRSVLERAGVQPAGDSGSYFQDFNMTRFATNPDESSIRVTTPKGETTFVMKRNLGTLLRAGLEWSAALAFAGNGRAPDAGAPDTLEGRVALVLLEGRLENFDPSWLASLGCRRALLVSNGLARRYSRPAFEILEYLTQGELVAGTSPRVDLAFVSNRVANAILKPAGTNVNELRGLDLDAVLPAVDLDGVEVAAKVAVKEHETLRTRNVVAKIEGVDPTLRDEFVVVGAHLDHVGRHDGKIFNGADDDASGSAGVLALAHAFAENGRRPRRSVILALWGAEEKGLLGSHYFVKHPTVPLESVIAALNMDMIGRDEQHEVGGRKEIASENTNSVHLVGSRRASLQLHDLVVGLNRSIGLEFDYDEERVFARSDQFWFADAGIPVAFFFTGFHPDYHNETDTVEKVNFAKMTRIVRLVYMTAHTLADLDKRLRRGRRF